MKHTTANAPAKINLVLEVVRRRSDGYHDLRTVMHTLELSDTLLFTPRQEGVLVSCEAPGVPANAENLAGRAAELFRQAYGVKGGVHIHIQKRIPVAAGLGGGSSDAAAALVGLCRFWGIPVNYTRLHALAQQLGSDVSFLLRGGCALGTGRGDRLFPWPAVPGLWMVVVNPGFAVPTPLVYKNLKLPLTRKKNYINLLRPAILKKNPEKIGQYLYNQLETVTFKMHPEVARIKELLLANGATAALMSGSGPTVFGLVPSPEAGQKVLRRFTGRYPFVCLTRTTGMGIRGTRGSV
jgi:4-diphosphocytidyl-2-C-methyl-D-erythritol kinase